MWPVLTGWGVALTWRRGRGVDWLDDVPRRPAPSFPRPTSASCPLRPLLACPVIVGVRGVVDVADRRGVVEVVGSTRHGGVVGVPGVVDVAGCWGTWRWRGVDGVDAAQLTWRVSMGSTGLAGVDDGMGWDGGGMEEREGV